MNSWMSMINLYLDRSHKILWMQYLTAVSTRNFKHYILLVLYTTLCITCFIYHIMYYLFYIPHYVLLVLYTTLCITCFIYHIMYYLFYIPHHVLLVYGLINFFYVIVCYICLYILWVCIIRREGLCILSLSDYFAKYI